MNKTLLVFVTVILLAIAGGVTYLLNDSNSGTTPQESLTNTNNTNESTTGSQTADTTGKYVEYSQDIIENTPGTKLLFFHASWCPQCRELEADIKHKGVPDDVTIIKVDYDSNQSLRQKYGVTLQTTVVKIDDNGNLVDKFVAYDDPSLDAVINKLL